MTTESGGTLVVTAVLAPIRTRSPMVIGPSTQEFTPMNTSSPITGAPGPMLVPMVTLCITPQRSPITTSGWIDSEPSAWMMWKSRPSRTCGGIQTLVTFRIRIRISA